jgi:hypothetical protein
MDDIREIFEQDTAGTDLDAELATAAQVLEKVALDQGVDLSLLTDDQVAELIVELMPSKLAADHEAAESEEEERKEHAEKREKRETSEKKAGIPDTVTFADVAAELGKYAAANGIDLNEVSREAYHEAFDRMAAAMTSPEYEAEKMANAEVEAKVAEADAIGRLMARAFVDEQYKLASDAKTEAAKGVYESIKGGLSKAKDFVGRNTDKALDFAKEHKGGLALGTATTGGAYMVGKGVGRSKQKRKMMQDMDKESAIEAAALEMARQALVDNGIDPDTGKVASDDDLVRIRALEILKESGWVE